MGGASCTQRRVSTQKLFSLDRMMRLYGRILVLVVLISLSSSKTLKLFNIAKIPATSTVSYDNGTTTTVTPNDDNGTTFTDEYTTTPAMALSGTTVMDEVIGLLEANDTMSLEEFEAPDCVIDNSTAVIDTTNAPIMVAAATTTLRPGMIRQCRCSEVDECKRQEMEQSQSCLEQCDDQLQFLGNDTESYMDCFEKNQDGITHAETCLESFLGNYCSSGNATNFLEAKEHEDYVKTKFILNKEYPKKSMPVLRKAHQLLAGFNHFYHCSKHCVHKRLLACFRKNNCTIRLPPIPSFNDAMNDCARKNFKISRSLRSTCQCLLHKKKLRGLFGSCALMTPSRLKSL